jgi:hypothetical protein
MKRMFGCAVLGESAAIAADPKERMLTTARRSVVRFVIMDWGIRKREWSRIFIFGMPLWKDKI